MFRRMLTRLVPALLFVLCLSGIFFLAASSAAPKQPPLGARKASRLTVDGLDFKDANKNGKLDKYEDWRLPVEQRVGDLVSQMTIEEKAGLMIHSSLMGFTGPGGVVLDAPPPPRAGSPAGFTPPRREGIEPLDRPTPAELIVKRNVRWILLRPNRREPPADSARFANGLQEIAEASRLGIPIVLSSDPRHSVSRPGAGPLQQPGERLAPNISQWPEQMYMDRPPVLTEFIDQVRAVFAHFNSSDGALLDLIFGRSGPTGKLPFDLPRDMESVNRQKEDVPHDFENPLFRTGFGLCY